MEKVAWKEYEDLTRERRVPPAPKRGNPGRLVRDAGWEEGSLGAQICEWIARHWLLYLLLITVAISAGCLLLDSIRGAR